MSILSYPRIHFRGAILLNAATANDDDVIVAIDRERVKLLPALADRTDADALAWLTMGVPATSIINGSTFQYLRSGWNPFGDLTAQFVDVRVCSTTDSDGILRPNDALVGSWLGLMGSPGDADDPPSKPKLCDLDPCGTVNCQLILGGFWIGNTKLGLVATCDRKAFGRWVSFRNATKYPGEQNYPGAGAIWQFTIPNDSLTFYQEDECGSGALEALEEAANQAKGIVVQFATYQVIPTLTDIELIESLQDPLNTTSNPAKGIVVGTVGVWEEGESSTVPADRMLRAPLDQTLLQEKVGPAAAYLGPATARVQRDRAIVSLNLISAFPEDGYQHPLVKADLGRVRLGVIPEGSDEPIAISAPIDYDYRSYELTSGILDVAHESDGDTLEQGTLVLLTEPDEEGDTVPMLIESQQVVKVMSVGPEDAGVYLDVNEETKVSIVVTERGGSPTEKVEVSLWEYQYVTHPAGPKSRALSVLHLVGGGIPLCHRLEFDPVITFAAGQTDPYEFTVKGLAPGGALIAFTLDGNPPPGRYPWRNASYAGFRVLPEDDFSQHEHDRRVSWDFMYEHVFRYYRLIYPAMSNVVPFDNQQAMESASGAIVEMTDPSKKASTRYMPVSRDLSTGKRCLIVEWNKSLTPPAAVASRRRFFWP